MRRARPSVALSIVSVCPCVSLTVPFYRVFHSTKIEIKSEKRRVKSKKNEKVKSEKRRVKNEK